MIFCDSEMTLDARIDGLEFRRVVACWGGGEKREGRESDGRDMAANKEQPGAGLAWGLSNVHRTGCVCVCAATSHRCQCQW